MQEYEYLMISTTAEMVRLREEHVVCITSDGNYSHICVVGGENFVVSYQLGHIEQLIGEQLRSSCGNFIRIGRGLIINTRYLCYISISRQNLFLIDASGRKYVQKASREALVQLKNVMDKGNEDGEI